MRTGNLRRRAMPLIAAVALVAAACGGAEESTSTTDANGGTAAPAPAPSADDEGTTELHVFHFKVNIQTQWQNLTDEYAAEQGDVTFVNEIIGGGNAWLPILKSKFAADRGPDIFIVEGPAQATEFADYLSDMTGEAWTENVFPWAIEPLTQDGKVLGMPVNVEGYGYIYNKAIFDDAGVTEKPTTISELRAAAEQLEAAGYVPFGSGYGVWWVSGLHLMNIGFARQEDPQAFLEQALAREVSFADDPVFQQLGDLVQVTLDHSEPDPLTTDVPAQNQLFFDGEAAMIQQGNWREIQILAANPDAEIGLVPMAINDDAADGDRLAVGVPFYFVVNSDSSEREQAEARDFLNWLVTSETGKRYLVEEFGFIPAYDNIPATGLGGVSQDILTYSAEGKIIPWVFGSFPDGSPQEMSEAFQRHVAGQATWAETLAEFDAIWDRLAG